MLHLYRAWRNLAILLCAPKDGNLLDAAEMTAVVTAPTDLGTGFNLLPPGTDVLADHERALPVAALV